MTTRCILVTTDARFRAKAERLFAKMPAGSCVVGTSLDEVVSALARARESDDEVVRAAAPVVFLDLDSTALQPYTLAENIHAALPQTRIVGVAFSVEPAVIQPARLHGISEVVQHFKAEELLGDIAAMEQ